MQTFLETYAVECRRQDLLNQLKVEAQARQRQHQCQRQTPCQTFASGMVATTKLSLHAKRVLTVFAAVALNFRLQYVLIACLP